MHDISIHEAWFADFAAAYLTAEEKDKGMLQLKIFHTSKVLEHMRLLVREEGELASSARACLLSALYHDVARFPQFARWRTFKDSLSTNHGSWGVKILKQHSRLDDEDARVSALVLAAVGMHNRYKLPAGLATEVRLVTEAVRDADKLDILRIMAEHLSGTGEESSAVVLHVADAPGCWTPKIAEDVLQGRMASYADLHYVNDFKLLLGSWLGELRFDITKRALAKSGHMAQILADLPDAAPVQAAKDRIERDLARLTA